MGQCRNANADEQSIQGEEQTILYSIYYRTPDNVKGTSEDISSKTCNKTDIWIQPVC